MTKIKLIKHAPGAPGLRFLGLGPGLIPSNGLVKLKKLFDEHAFWARDRSYNQLKALLAGSTVVISLWSDNRIIGFGRATSDGVFRAVLWDIVVADDLQGIGLGSQVLKALLSAKEINRVEKIYLMTTKSSDFYLQLGFQECTNQNLLLINPNQ